MPRCRRSIFAAVGLTFLVASSPPQQGRQSQDDQTQQQITNALERIAGAAESDNKAADYNPECEPGEDNRRSDLCAQWKAADAANKAAIWTQRSAYIAIVAALIGFLTLGAAVAAAWFARLAAKHTETGAKAARAAVAATRKANRISEDTASKQLRAYIGTKGARAFYVGAPLSRIVIELQNFGQTPATMVISSTRIYLDAQLTGAPGPDTDFVFKNEFGIVEPGAEPILFIELPENWIHEHLDGLRSGGLRLAAETRIDYVDIDGEARWRTFTYYLPDLRKGRDPTKGAIMSISPTGNEAG